MPQPLKFTFGIELECIVRYPRVNYIEALEAMGHLAPSASASSYDHVTGKLVRKHMALHLQRCGHTARHSGQERTQDTWTIDSDSSICSSSLFHQEEAEYGYCDIEIKSPVFPLSPNAFAEIEDVIYNLTHIADLEFICDTSCGLHVHVGNENAGFPLQTLKNFSILTTIFEAHFSSLHPPERVVDNPYLKTQFAPFVGKSPWDIAMEIQLCRNTHELVCLWSKQNDEPNKNLAYNLLHLVSEPGFKTIEFRQHKATIATDEIIKWIELTTALVQYAHAIPFEDLMRLVEDVAFDPRRDIVDLLFVLGLDNLAEYYSGCERYEHPRLEGAWVDESLLGYDVAVL